MGFLCLILKYIGGFINKLKFSGQIVNVNVFENVNNIMFDKSVFFFDSLKTIMKINSYIQNESLLYWL